MFGTIALGGFLLAFAGLCYWRNRFKKARLWACFGAGLCLAYAVLFQIGATLARKAVEFASPVTQRWLGFGGSTLILIMVAGLVFLLVDGLHPKKGKPESWMGPVFLVAGAILVVFGPVAWATLQAQMTALLNSTAASVGMG